MNPFWMVLADLRKTLVSSLGILVLLSLAFAVALSLGLIDRAARAAGAHAAEDVDLVVGAPGSRLDLVLAAVYLRTDEVLPLLPESEWRRVESDARVAVSSPLVFADHWSGFPVVGVGADFPRLRPGLRIASGRWPATPFEVIAGASTALVPDAEFEGSHGAAPTSGFASEVHHEHVYRVVGTLQATGSPWDRALITPAEGIWSLHGSAERRVSAVLVKPKNFAAAYALRADLRTGATTAAFPGEVLAGLFGLFDRVRDGLSVVFFLVQALVFAAVVLSLLASLPSRARWIGLLRALGAGSGYILATLWIQSFLLFAFATLFGAALGWAGAQALASWFGELTGLRFVVQGSGQEILSLGVFLGAGLLGALVPAIAGYSTSVRKSLLGQ